ncbi:MFS transporter [Phyllobacterium sp. SB3]|uniref:MFS transporter n=1 Tax=Phyllobacterium sp. SB3 TaxID=3156073 RepID=UPI0032AF8AC3
MQSCKGGFLQSYRKTIEWYDYYIFGVAAVLIFSTHFFPNLDPVTGTLASMTTLAVAFIARPFGGIIFGHFGDRIGRKTMLVYSIGLMGAATFVIGLLKSRPDRQSFPFSSKTLD